MIFHGGATSKKKSRAHSVKVVSDGCYDSYNVGHPNWPLGKPLPTKSESESPQAPKSGAITVIEEASGDEDEGEMPE